MSQRALGLLFSPPVTTQFISNVERGVTPLPPTHIPVLAKALATSDSELMALLEKEYALKLNGRLGRPGGELENLGGEPSPIIPSLVVSNTDFDFMKSLYDSYRGADTKTRQAFATVCESFFKSKSGVSSSSSSSSP